LWTVLRFNDRVQAALFSRTRLAAIYPASAIAKPFRFNAYYPEWQVRGIDAAQWRLDVAGRVSDWTLKTLLAVAAGKTNHATYLHRGLEPDRGVERSTAARVPAPRRC
jgi:hypothetical protein